MSLRGLLTARAQNVKGDDGDRMTMTMNSLMIRLLYDSKGAQIKNISETSNTLSSF